MMGHLRYQAQGSSLPAFRVNDEDVILCVYSKFPPALRVDAEVTTSPEKERDVEQNRHE